ncbi:MAG: hypothetical protein ACFFDH_11735 [Promethearchaeota archaeon]
MYPIERIKIIIYPYLIFVIIALLTSFLPFIIFDDGYYIWDVPGYVLYYIGTYEGLLLILISIIKLNKLKILTSVKFGFSGCLGILFNIIFIYIFFGIISGFAIGGYLLIIALAVFFIVNIYLIRINESEIHELSFKKDEVRDYILKLPSIYSQITLHQILNNLQFRKKYLIDLKNLIEEMIYKKEIEGDLRLETLFLKKGTEKEIITEVGEPETDYKKRLFGMIRLRKEINLDEAAEFLNLKPKDIESLLYELAGENTIQGSFQGNKFIIESDIDQFINVLDHSFDRWEDSQNRYKIE